MITFFFSQQNKKFNKGKTKTKFPFHSKSKNLSLDELMQK